MDAIVFFVYKRENPDWSDLMNYLIHPSHWSFSQAPRGFGVCYRGLPTFSARSTYFKTLLSFHTLFTRLN